MQEICIALVVLVASEIKAVRIACFHKKRRIFVNVQRRFAHNN